MRLYPQAFVLAAAALTLGGCAAVPISPTRAPDSSPAAPSRTPTPSATPDLRMAAETRTDSQGSVEFAITPLNLQEPRETLGFEVSMNTHSVDLSWDLAALSTLITDTGIEVSGLSWPISSGHHVSGVLAFPSSVDGAPLLEGASEITLIVRDAGATERVFSWSLTP